MSSHRRRVKHFSRASGPRKALLRGLINSLVEHGRISTTVDRAKELRRHVEKSITLGKKGTLAARRLLISKLANTDIAAKVIEDLSVRFKDRPGGYTRIIKIGRRPGDTAEMAFIEFVDYDYKAKDGQASKAEDKAAKKLKAKTESNLKKAIIAKKKASKKIQKASRVLAR